ncbi:hypothetical protein COCSUDRAFT_58238 [Coccomyxa subellipsoidea C-169]|uniref:Uncharacterized protein n=1 Tax=Coccomyxa subellipsoidea (strain C-169) TaxID=574566 RepID=I0YNN6_COCSC|nr:hypothetical protein COCSUDRAFT_58238 [Coccomyxa subellipsoidea C-169]EIE20005.1 hypothetical protein COCSUDRAFT_58238 [Coccomyxa subellipsoidea C-169]|eukprot:XP_005644549.1 hypothetical protein COCSUDRAFT_58238 [Coccomyxa subellipsoidea C-169]
MLPPEVWRLIAGHRAMQARTLDVGVLTEAQEIDIGTALLRADSNWERLKTLSIIQLQSVMLKNLVPGSLTLPQSAALHPSLLWEPADF